MIGRGQSCLGAELSCGWELLHVCANLGKDAGCRFFLDARSALKQQKCFSKGRVLHPATDLLVRSLDLLIQELQVTKGVTNQETSVVCKAVSSDGCRDLREFDSCFLRKLGDLVRTKLAIKQRLEHQSARHAEHIGETLELADAGTEFLDLDLWFVLGFASHHAD